MAWQAFLKQHAGQGLSMKQLSEMYHEERDIPEFVVPPRLPPRVVIPEFVAPPKHVPKQRYVPESRLDRVLEELRKCREHGRALEEQIKQLKNPAVAVDRLKRINAMMEREINALRK